MRTGWIAWMLFGGLLAGLTFGVAAAYLPGDGGVPVPVPPELSEPEEDGDEPGSVTEDGSPMFEITVVLDGLDPITVTFGAEERANHRELVRDAIHEAVDEALAADEITTEEAESLRMMADRMGSLHLPFDGGLDPLERFREWGGFGDGSFEDFELPWPDDGFDRFERFWERHGFGEDSFPDFDLPLLPLSPDGGTLIQV